MLDDFFKTLTLQAEADSDLYLLIADPGFYPLSNFRNRCPNQFIDFGAADTNMIGVAAGLALCGKNVYCYSVIPFLPMRAYDQLKIDVAYHALNVKLIGLRGGSSAPGGRHHPWTEDLAIMRSLTHFAVVVPADRFEAQCLAVISYQRRQPMYISLGGAEEPVVHKEQPDFRIGKAMYLGEGKDVTIFAIGSMVYTGAEVAMRLADKGVEASLINMHTLRPLDALTIRKVCSTHGIIFALEEHNVDGGLGSAIAEVLSETGYAGIFRRLGIPEDFKLDTEKANPLRIQCGLTAEAVSERILSQLRAIQAARDIDLRERRPRSKKRVRGEQIFREAGNGNT